MKAFVKSDVFRAMNAGFVVDEGVPSLDDTMLVTYEDRRPWREYICLTLALGTTVLRFKSCASISPSFYKLSLLS